MSGRRAARRTALFLLYQWDVTGQPLASLYDGEEVPDEVAIDEAVNLAKRYATDDAARLVNGILGRIVRERV
jgi:N utilization substance protein B